MTDGCGALPTTLDSDVACITSGRAEAQHERPGELPVLEPLRVVHELVAVHVDPTCAAHVDEQGMVPPSERAVGRVHESNAARAAQEFSRRDGQIVAPESRDVDA